MYCKEININALLELFKDKGYNLTYTREANLDRLVYDNIIVATFNPDLYTYNDYDVCNLGKLVTIYGKQRLYVESFDYDIIVLTIIESIKKYEAKAEVLNEKLNILVKEQMRSMTAAQCIEQIVRSNGISPYLTGYCTLPNGQICWGTEHGKIGVIIVNSDCVFYFKKTTLSNLKWDYNNCSIMSPAEMIDFKQCLDDVFTLPMKRNKKYWKFTWKTLIKYASNWIPGFCVGNRKVFLPR